MRTFHLQRDEDVSGVSGTGKVAQGVEFDDGTCVIRWMRLAHSTQLYECVEDVDLIHGHDGATRIIFHPKLVVE